MERMHKEWHMTMELEIKNVTSDFVTYNILKLFQIL